MTLIALDVQWELPARWALNPCGRIRNQGLRPWLGELSARWAYGHSVLKLSHFDTLRQAQGVLSQSNHKLTVTVSNVERSQPQA